MAFVSGAWQVGKTTLAKQISQHFQSTLYLNWDAIKLRFFVGWVERYEVAGRPIHNCYKFTSLLRCAPEFREISYSQLLFSWPFLDTYQR